MKSFTQKSLKMLNYTFNSNKFKIGFSNRFYYTHMLSLMTVFPMIKCTPVQFLALSEDGIEDLQKDLAKNENNYFEINNIFESKFQTNPAKPGPQVALDTTISEHIK
jgi:hypothetical protein